MDRESVLPSPLTTPSGDPLVKNRSPRDSPVRHHRSQHAFSRGVRFWPRFVLQDEELQAPVCARHRGKTESSFKKPCGDRIGMGAAASRGRTSTKKGMFSVASLELRSQGTVS
jgi:hypothetical protein